MDKLSSKHNYSFHGSKPKKRENNDFNKLQRFTQQHKAIKNKKDKKEEEMSKQEIHKLTQLFS